MGYRVKKNLGINEIEYTCELKYDGASINLIYEDGILVRGITRGNGLEGDDVTLNVKIGTSYDGSTYITTGGGTGSTTPSGIYTATPSLNGLKHVKFTGIIENHTTTGAQKIITTYRSADGGSDRPFPLVNPTSTDNSALEGNPGMNGSRILIWEILL